MVLLLQNKASLNGLLLGIFVKLHILVLATTYQYSTTRHITKTPIKVQICRHSAVGFISSSVSKSFCTPQLWACDTLVCSPSACTYRSRRSLEAASCDIAHLPFIHTTASFHKFGPPRSPVIRFGPRMNHVQSLAANAPADTTRKTLAYRRILSQSTSVAHAVNGYELRFPQFLQRWHSVHFFLPRSTRIWTCLSRCKEAISSDVTRACCYIRNRTYSGGST